MLKMSSVATHPISWSLGVDESICLGVCIGHGVVLLSRRRVLGAWRKMESKIPLRNI